MQARMGSRRLKGKSLKLLYGRPMIYWVLDRMRRVMNIDCIVVATSEDKSDDALAEYVKTLSDISLYRGSLDNVQARFLGAVRKFQIDEIVRVTGDNPLISHRLIDIMFSNWDKMKIDYMGTKGGVLGIGAEIFTLKSFEEVVKVSNSSYDYEHVSPPYYQKQNWPMCILDVPCDFRCSGLQLTVDTEEDFIKISDIYAKYIEDNYVDLLRVIADYRNKN